MEVIFVKDNRKNPACDQIRNITTGNNYIDAYFAFDEIKYFNNLPNASIGAYVHSEKHKNTLKPFKLETLTAEKLKHLSKANCQLIRLLQTGEYYVPQKFTDALRKCSIDYFFLRYQNDVPKWFASFLEEHNIKTKTI